MCDVGLITLGLGIVSTAANTIGAIQQQRSYEDYKNKQTAATVANYQYQTRALQNKYDEQKAASADKLQQLQIQNMQAKATAQASAASSGIEGTTIDNLMSGYDRASAINNYVAAKNLDMMGLQYNDELEAMRVSAINSINAQQPYTGTSGFSALMNGLGSTLSSYSQNTGTGTNYLRGNSTGGSTWSLSRATKNIIGTTSIYGGYA